ncbi:MAG: hypothetical protein KC493_10510 [Bacteriovoracaceae bacterium]|nr:hypothetical protein [Bacteriovoracaceae bacterium]
MKILLLILILLPLSLKAEWDFKATQLYRSFPTGFYINATGGYSLPVWKADDKVLYGYIRPSVTGQTSFVVNAAKAQVDINPISFLNLYAGKSYTDRNFNDLDTFDCVALVCDTKLKRDFYGARLALGAGPILVMGEAKWYRSELDEHHPGRQYADELSSLVSSAGSDTLFQRNLIVGFKFSPNYMVGYLGQFNEMRNTQQTSKMQILLNQFHFSNGWSLIAGPGMFTTRDDSNIFTVLSLLTWKPVKGLPLF